MKKAVFSVLVLLLLAVAAGAQERDRQSKQGRQDTGRLHQRNRQPDDPAWDKNKRMRDRNNRAWKARPDSGAPAGVPDSISNRRIYKSPRTGQKATPTGQDATGTNSSQSPNPKNAGNKQ